MATAKTKTVETPAPAPAVVFGLGKFAFAPAKVEAIPAPPTNAPRTGRLPFDDFFDYAFGQGKDGAHGQTIFVPNTFWTAPKDEGGRGLENVPKELRAKYREAHKAWVKKDEEPRSWVGLMVIERKQGQQDPQGGEFAEDGYSLFVVDKTRT